MQKKEGQTTVKHIRINYHDTENFLYFQYTRIFQFSLKQMFKVGAKIEDMNFEGLS